MAKDVSVLIPAREEMFLKQTIDNVLANIEADTEVIAVCDGYWPDPPISDNDRVTILHYSKSVGQRRATNDAAKLSRSKYVMKLDAHCSVSKGFDRVLMEDCPYDWTIVPMMYNLHAFDWRCTKCGERTYQGPKLTHCAKCDQDAEHEMVVVWRPRRGRKTVTWRFDKTMHFQYWHDGKKRPPLKEGMLETMSMVGCCWFTHRDRYWELEGLDEKHGSWGQVGTEIACKSWLSGGKMVTNTKAWFGHMFRTRNDGFGFPYHISGNEQERARIYSRDLWLNDKWPKAKLPLKWLVEHFAPVPGWEETA